MQTTQPNIIGTAKVPLIVLVLCAIAGCRSATPPQRSQTVTPAVEVAAQAAPPLLAQRTFCRYCVLNGSLSVRTPTLSADGTFRIFLAGRDSLQGTIYGPLGIVAARAYCTPEETVVFDALSQHVYQLQLPLSEQSVLPFPVYREELLALLRCELPFDTASYRPLEHLPGNGSFRYIRHDTQFVDLAELSTDGELLAYQRKTHDNRLLFAIEYSDYRAWESERYPARIRITAPQPNIELVLIPDDIHPQPSAVPFRFRLPASVPRTVVR